jgi:hypothetical protein
MVTTEAIVFEESGPCVGAPWQQLTCHDEYRRRERREELPVSSGRITSFGSFEDNRILLTNLGPSGNRV